MYTCIGVNAMGLYLLLDSIELKTHSLPMIIEYIICKYEFKKTFYMCTCIALLKQHFHYSSKRYNTCSFTLEGYNNLVKCYQEFFSNITTCM